METRNAFMLAIALVLIAGAIFYLESMKAPVPPVQPQAAAPAAGSPESQAAQQDDIFSLYPKAPELAGIEGYINAPDNLTIASLRGKVVLLDIWTYTCINCIRTLPYIESWHEKYEKDGLVVIGVHSPEFEFEKKYENVLAAVEKYGIRYPVVLDSEHATWNAYQNRYWPRKYLIDANGRIRYDHIGEGGYGETEAKIVELLSEAKNAQVKMEEGQPNATAVDIRKVGTPEIYFGSLYRRAPFGNAQPLFEGDEFSASIPPGSLTPNIAYLEGSWINGIDGITLSSETGAVEIVFTAKNVNVVAGSMNGTNLTIYIDGKKAEKQDYCPDAPKGTCTVTGQRLYSVVALQDYGTHRLRIEAQGKGFELFTFTFG